MTDTQTKPFYILSLDGGGSLGVYTLGVLREIEALLQYKWKKPLHESFDLIYGTSTGSIIAALLALGKDVNYISEKYFQFIPSIMNHKMAADRSRALKENTNQEFKGQKFDSFLTKIGIVTTNYDKKKPMIFKNERELAYEGKGSFVTGFGCKISDAVVASCSAFPFFERQKVKTENQGEPELQDGGFVANDPTLFAIIDAIQALKIPKDKIRVLSIGVGNYPPSEDNLVTWGIKQAWSLPLNLFQTTLESNRNTLEIIRGLYLGKDVKTVRIDKTFSDLKYKTNFLEYEISKLNTIKSLGRDSYFDKAQAIKELFDIKSA